MKKELELLDVCGLITDAAFRDADDEQYEKLCEEIGAEMQGELTFNNWHMACHAVQARMAAA